MSLFEILRARESWELANEVAAVRVVVSPRDQASIIVSNLALFGPSDTIEPTFRPRFFGRFKDGLEWFYHRDVPAGSVLFQSAGDTPLE